VAVINYYGIIYMDSENGLFQYDCWSGIITQLSQFSWPWCSWCTVTCGI